jgi:hypothetical protein
MALLPKDGIGKVKAGEYSLVRFAQGVAQEEEGGLGLPVAGNREVQGGGNDIGVDGRLTDQFVAHPGLADAGAAVKDEHEWFGALGRFERGLEDGEGLFPVNELSDRGS